MDSPGARATTRGLKARPSSQATAPRGLLRIDPGTPPPIVPSATNYAIRVFDVIVAGSLLMVLAAPMLCIGLLVRLTSRGPTLYFQERVGLAGRRFRLIKFRTMRLEAEAFTGPVWARRGDDRCTTLGRVLRRFSIDELPQMWNVLRGDMSIVGPRPERPYFVKQFARELPGYMDRHLVPAGITGWAQINGCRGDTSVERRLDYDLDYVRRRSFGLNLWILLATPWKVLVDRNAFSDLSRPTFQSAGWLVAAVALTIGLEGAIISRAVAINVDGLMFIDVARQLERDPVQAMRSHDQHPGYPAMIVAVERALELLGCSPGPGAWTAATRVASSVCGVLSVIAMWLFARRLFGQQVANLAALSIAVLPLFRMNASDALSDTPHLVFYLLAAWCAAEGLSSARASWWAACGLAGGAAFWVRPEGLEAPLIGGLLLVATLLLRWAPKAQTVRSLVALGAAMAAVVVPYVVLAGKITSKQLPFFKHESVPLFIVTESQEAARLAAKAKTLVVDTPATDTPEQPAPVDQPSPTAADNSTASAATSPGEPQPTTTSQPGSLAAESAVSPPNTSIDGQAADSPPSDPSQLPTPYHLSEDTQSLSENRRGLAHFAMPCEQNVPVPLSSKDSRIGSQYFPPGPEFKLAREAAAKKALADSQAAPSPQPAHKAADATSSALSWRVMFGVARRATVAYFKNMAWGFRFAFMPLYLLGNWEMIRRRVPWWTIALPAGMGALHIGILYWVYFLSGYMDQRHVMVVVALALPFAALGMLYGAELLNRIVGPRLSQQAALAAIVAVNCSAVVPRALVRMNADLTPVFTTAEWVHAHARPGDAVISNTPYVEFYGQTPGVRLAPETATIEAAILGGSSNLRYDFAVLDLKIEGYRPQWREQIERDFDEVMRLENPLSRGHETKLLVYRRRVGAPQSSSAGVHAEEPAPQIGSTPSAKLQ